MIPELTKTFPPEIDSSINSFTCAAQLYALSVNNDRDSNYNLFRDIDRRYILYWMFAAGANDYSLIPGDLRDTSLGFTSVLKVDTFSQIATNFKLFNRLQVKYRVLGSSFNGTPIILSPHSLPKVGQTKEPCNLPFPATDVVLDGQEGPSNGSIVTNTDIISQVNDGSPDAPAVRAFNTLYGKNSGSAPLFWENIGSKISFSPGNGTNPSIYSQPFPTYSVYQNGVLLNTLSQPVSPIGNFQPSPFPSGLYPCNYFFSTPGGRCGDMHSPPDITARPSPY